MEASTFEGDAQLKRKGSILVMSMLVMMVSCASGVWQELKPKVAPVSLRFVGPLIGSLFGTQVSLADKDELYQERGSYILAGQPEE
jgi:hypothetical protein